MGSRAKYNQDHCPDDNVFAFYIGCTQLRIPGRALGTNCQVTETPLISAHYGATFNKMCQSKVFEWGVGKGDMFADTLIAITLPSSYGSL